ncbi:ABC-type transport system involved in multi-copper enzyme maturation, permease component OS=Singulisphaera acidiphila (strain ATCC BAA-1392 / DSM 18658 / VKM B-2454 / MOB10) GN=Sinac_5948 PE=4 SV=1: ABC2_membrane_2 [Gemmata massiliana]|uniref:ABC-2 type transporter transmembrane domain-containing protein n=1 Tax=Gemmata massiliana TaxID=1210884 RepID=A0A6P2DCU5_9BACT|nr:ABC transporter permease [Gemmata massiliana]VTR99419.1 ABC-type transport system involved in multi-copper enzyme maturation, permease component OS=Singulisphaera acidiphila (strain ATCC BAA-1392 / DSM 18658 / VKM B-2454 / MOB10) GN=Sinac_5948 PE=4 SV=1: ABC2_membrane_2 [Gemmata massiliana]
MSSIPPVTTDPIPAAPAVGPLRAPVETAPSAIRIEGQSFARIVGFAGLFSLVLGAVVVIATRVTGQPRIVPEGWGFLFAGVGIALMLYHAITDGEQEIRRLYGMFAAAFLVLALAAALLPGPFKGVDSKTVGFYFLPWGLGAGFLALLFLVPFVRHETDEFLRTIGTNVLLGVGTLLCVGLLVKGIWEPDWLAGPGLALAILGLGFLCAYFSQVSTDEGAGYSVAFALGVVGAAAIFFAFARTVFPTVLYDGPSVLRNAYQATDYWKTAGRGLVIVAFLGLVALGALGKFPTWLRATLAGVGLACAGVFILASTKAVLTTPPTSFLVPGGLLIGSIGLVYVLIALGVCLDNVLVTLIRRELSSYFVSPIGYSVLAGMAIVEWVGYSQFYEVLSEAGRQQMSVPEPIVRMYFFSLFPVICVIFQVPALTMRLLAEEKRTGSLEVLLTSPVSEGPVVLSKFLATWLFFLVCWLPAGLFLIALRMEAGQAFDYRPLLSFYVALAGCGAAFVSAGLFFSALTSNQIVSAVLTLALMFFMMACYFVKDQATGFGPLGRQLLGRLSYIDLWLESLRGQLPVRDVLVWVSAAVLGLFLSVKVLEARKWN